MYINFWYPVCIGTELTDKPIPVTLLGLRFVAFRDSAGKPHVLSDTCVHRGGSLSGGKVVGDCVQCPYHGWTFAGDGSCATIPLQRSGKPPARAKVDAYPTEERYGVVFAFLGDLPEDERPHLFEIAEWDKEGWRPNIPTVTDIHCYYERSVENGLDPIHNEFVHPSQGLPSIIEGSETVEETEWGTSFMIRYGELNKKLTEYEDMRSDPSHLRAGSLHHGPNTLVTRICFNQVNEFVQYGFEAPVDETLTRVYLVNMRNCMLDPAMDEEIRTINRKVGNEDIAILENLWPLRTPDTTTKELLTPGMISCCAIAPS